MMTGLQIVEPATPPSGATLKALESAIGFVPNIFAVMAATPNVLTAFIELNTQFAAGSLTAIEREIVQVAVSVENDCNYCVAGHTAFAQNARMKLVDLKALRSQSPLADQKHQALRRLAESLARNRGRGCETALAAFLAAGYSTEQAQEVILGVCTKMFSNIAANLLQVPVDDQFTRFSWERFGQPVSLGSN